LALITVVALSAATTVWAQDGDAPIWGRWSGNVALRWEASRANESGPFASSNTLQPSSVAALSEAGTLQLALRGQGRGWLADGVLEHSGLGTDGSRLQGQINELAWTHDAGAWQFSVGRKIVAWDVGYAFRPNDVVQQEARRTLVSVTPHGKPLVMAERFDADTAWALVWVNPLSAADARNGDEPALAARAYVRDGAVDWHAFARWAERTGASIGLAAAWVANDALELHASLRALQTPSARQALIGGTWTSESQLGLTFETWWDGTVRSPLTGVTTTQRNIYLRLSYDHEGWQPSLDVLWQPADGGRVVTTALTWKGNRWQIGGGWRVFGGPDTAMLAQLPMHQQGYVQALWTF
jgi:hypothetical protein